MKERGRKWECVVMRRELNKVGEEKKEGKLKKKRRIRENERKQESDERIRRE